MPKRRKDNDDWWPYVAEAVEQLRSLRYDRVCAAEVEQLRQRLKEIESQLRGAGWEGTQRSTARRDLTTLLNDLERLGTRPHAYRTLLSRFVQILGDKLLGPIQAIRVIAAYRDLVIALVRIAAALALEARFAAGEEGLCLSPDAEKRARDLARINASDLPYPRFPSLAGIYASRQLSWSLLEMRSSARTALLIVDAPGPLRDGGFLSTVLLAGMSFVSYADTAEVIASQLERNVPDQTARQWIWEKVRNVGLRLPMEKQLLSVLMAYWAHVTGHGRVVLGFCWHCGRFFGGRSRAKRYCSVTCRVAFSREVGPRRVCHSKRGSG